MITVSPSLAGQETQTDFHSDDDDPAHHHHHHHYHHYHHQLHWLHMLMPISSPARMAESQMMGRTPFYSPLHSMVSRSQDDLTKDARILVNLTQNSSRLETKFVC